MGTLVRILVDVELINEASVAKGEIGIIIDNDVKCEEHFFTNFDYLIFISSGEILVFEEEIEVYI